MSVITNEIVQGEPRQVGDFELTPLTNVFKIQFPGHHAGFVWNRPRAVVVKTHDGQEKTLPVTDVTRVAIWTMLAGGLLGAVAVGVLFWKR